LNVICNKLESNRPQNEHFFISAKSVPRKSRVEDVRVVTSEWTSRAQVASSGSIKDIT
jgi:hypothetical protein